MALLFQDLRKRLERGRHREAKDALEQRWKAKPGVYIGDLHLALALIFEHWGDYWQAQGQPVDAIQNYGLSGIFVRAFRPRLKTKMLALLKSRRIAFETLTAEKRVILWVQLDPEIDARFDVVRSQLAHERDATLGMRDRRQRLIKYCRQGEHVDAYLLAYQWWRTGSLSGKPYRMMLATVFDLWGDYRRDEGRDADALENYGISGELAPATQPRLKKKIMGILQRRKTSLRDVLADEFAAPWMESDPELRTAFVP